MALVLASGCIGTIETDEAPARGGRSGVAGGEGPSGGQPPGAAAPLGPMPLRRLTRAELGNTLTQLLGFDVQVPPELPADVLGPSQFPIGGNISRVEAEVLMGWSRQLAAAAVEKPGQLLPCPAMPTARVEQDACARRFITQFGRRAFRRPLAPSEVSDLVAYYNIQLRSGLGYDFVTSVRGLIQLMLLSPRFLYHWEQGPAVPIPDGDGRIQLGPNQIASRLSYLFWASMPDDQLLDAADHGELATPAQIEAQARRLLGNRARSKTLAESFHLQWLQIGDIAQAKKAARYKFTPELGQAMLSETRKFVSWVWEGDGRFETLLTSTTTFIDNAALARLYGVAGFSGNTFKQVTLEASQRAGLLTQPSFLTAQTLPSELNPIKRGKTVVERLLCLTVPPPPKDVPPAKAPDPNLPTRERLAEHEKNACASCHRTIDPPGLAFEHYDAVGAYRTAEGGKLVDASGSITFASGETRTVQDAVELAKILAQSDEVRSCVAKHWLRYALRRGDVPGDQPSLRAVQKAFAAEPHDLRDLVIALTRTTAFGYRSQAEGELSQ